MPNRKFTAIFLHFTSRAVTRQLHTLWFLAWFIIHSLVMRGSLFIRSLEVSILRSESMRNAILKFVEICFSGGGGVHLVVFCPFNISAKSGVLTLRRAAPLCCGLCWGLRANSNTVSSHFWSAPVFCLLSPEYLQRRLPTWQWWSEPVSMASYLIKTAPHTLGGINHLGDGLHWFWLRHARFLL